MHCLKKHLGVVTVVHVDWYLISPCQSPLTSFLKWFLSQSSEVQHHIEPAGFLASIKGKGSGCHPKERPTPEGAGGSRGDPNRNMCQRADAVPSYKSLPGSVGARIMSLGSGTLCRGTMNPGFGRSDRKVACCEKCSATLVALKKQALSLAVHHHFSCKVSNHDAVMGEELGQACSATKPSLLTFMLMQICTEKYFIVKNVAWSPV